MGADGGEVLPWKRLWIHTAAGRFRVEISPSQIAWCYKSLLTVCPMAVGISYTGEVRIGATPENMHPAEWLQVVVGRTRRAFGHLVRRPAIVGAVLGLSAAAATAGLFLVMPNAADKEMRAAAAAAVYALIGLLIAWALGVLWLNKYLRKRQVMHALRQRLEQLRHDPQPEFTGEVFQPVRPMAFGTGKRTVGEVVMIAVCMLVWGLVPVLGVAASSIAIGVTTWRSDMRGWPRTVAWISLFVSLAATGALLALALLGR